jgi:hypothetical protein
VIFVGWREQFCFNYVGVIRQGQEFHRLAGDLMVRLLLGIHTGGGHSVNDIFPPSGSLGVARGPIPRRHVSLAEVQSRRERVYPKPCLASTGDNGNMQGVPNVIRKNLNAALQAKALTDKVAEWQMLKQVIGRLIRIPEYKRSPSGFCTCLDNS